MTCLAESIGASTSIEDAQALWAKYVTSIFPELQLEEINSDTYAVEISVADIDDDTRISLFWEQAIEEHICFAASDADYESAAMIFPLLHQLLSYIDTDADIEYSGSSPKYEFKYLHCREGKDPLELGYLNEDFFTAYEDFKKEVLLYCTSLL